MKCISRKSRNYYYTVEVLKHEFQTTITITFFGNNGNMWYGNPIVKHLEQQNNFIATVSPSEEDKHGFLTFELNQTDRN